MQPRMALNLPCIQDNLERLILLSLPPKYWGHRCVLPSLFFINYFIYYIPSQFPLSLPPISFLPIHAFSISVQKRAGLSEASTKHGISSLK